jgi:hypothetical protein
VPDFSLLIDCLLLIIIAALLRPRILRGWRRLREVWKTHLHRRWKPASPHDCPLCCSGVSLSVVKPCPVLP